MKNKKQSVLKLIAIVLSITFILSALTSYAIAAPDIEAVRSVLRYDYVDILTEEQLNYETAEEIIEGLEDPYTAIFDGRDMEMIFDSIDGEYVGMGINLSYQEDGNIMVEHVFSNSPAERAGLNSGDLIIEIDGNKLGMNLEGNQSLLTSMVEGMEKHLKVIRDGAELDLVVTVAYFHIPVVQSTMLANNILYVLVTSFSQDLSWRFADEYARYDDVDGIIIDLRDNSGGYATGCYDLADDFLSAGALLWTKKRDNSPQPLYFHNVDMLYTQPLVVLVNEFSASASEVFAGAMQDYQRGVILGNQTYGKWCGQIQAYVGEDTYMHYTNSYILSPKKKAYNAIGMMPDIIVDDENAIDMAAALLTGKIAQKTAN